MTPKYLVNIGDERLYFDEDRRPTERPDEDLTSPDASMPIWPVDDEVATVSAWDAALASYTHDERASAKIRLIGTEAPQD